MSLDDGTAYDSGLRHWYELLGPRQELQLNLLHERVREPHSEEDDDGPASVKDHLVEVLAKQDRQLGHDGALAELPLFTCLVLLRNVWLLLG